MTPAASISTSNWVVTISALAIIIGLDFAWAVSRRHKDTSLKEATAWSLFYVSLAVAFGLNLSQWLGAPKAELTGAQSRQPRKRLSRKNLALLTILSCVLVFLGLATYGNYK